MKITFAVFLSIGTFNLVKCSYFACSDSTVASCSDLTVPSFTEKAAVPSDDVSSESTAISDVTVSTEGEQNNKVNYEGDRVFKVISVNSKHRKRIQLLEKNGWIEKWYQNSTTADIYVKKDNLENVTKVLEDASMKYFVLIEDVQRAIENENPPLSDYDLEELTSRKGHKLTFDHYHRMSDLHEYLDYMASSQPSFVSVQTIGNSVEGRPLKLVKISSGNPNATAMWIDGGIHAREWISSATTIYIINELIENRNTLSEEIKAIDFYILPLVNPDGYEYSHERERLWRKNRKKKFGNYCVGTDLNRNWAHEWGGQGSGKVPCQEIYAGTGPLSEPETKAIADFILSEPAKFKGFVTFHSYGQYILYPWGHTKKLPDDVDDLDRVGKLAASAMKQSGGSSYTVGNSATLLYPAAGASDDWAKGVAKIKYAYTIELRDTGRYGFLLPASYIMPTAKEAFVGIKTIAKHIDS